jgi:hypothetical protein
MFRKKPQKKIACRDDKSTLASILLSMKVITKEQLEQARTEREEHETSHADMLLASTLRSKGFCSSDDLSKALKIQDKMLQGDRASVALDLMEARLERYSAGEEQLRREVEKRRDTLIVIPFSPVTAKAM